MSMFRTKWEVTCNRCGYLSDAMTGLTEGKDARPGDYSMCLGCGHVTMFAPDLTLRELTEAERREAAKDIRIAQALIARAVVMGI
jgi:hypothetical protein